MASPLKMMELDTACAVCAARTDDLQLIDEVDTLILNNETPFQTKLAALSAKKAVPSGRICGGCVQRATDAWNFQQQLQAAQAEPSLSDKIRVLRQRLRELTQKIDVFIVIGPEKTDGQPVYTAENIIMVDKNMLQDADEEGEATKNEKGERVFQCSICPDSYKKLSEYMEHVRQHPADSPHTCWICGKQFKTREGFNSHKPQHVDIDQLACKLCNQMFQSPMEMKRHTCDSRCPSCSEYFPDREELSEHARACHGASGTPPYVCPVCMESFTIADKLLAHAVKHRQTKQFVCGYEGCVLRFANRNNLMSHIRKLHAGVAATAVRCTVAGCDETFVTPEEMRAHAAEAHAAPQCHVCQNTFQTQSALRKHLKTHTTGPKPGRGRPKKVKTEVVEVYQEPVAIESSELQEVEVPLEDYSGMEQHTVLIQQHEDMEEGVYQLECVEGEDMAVEMLEEEVEYLEVETLEDEIEDDTKPDMIGL